MATDTGIFTALDGGEVQVSSTLPLGPVTSHVGVRFQKLGIQQVFLVASTPGLAESLAQSPEVSTGMRFEEEYVLDGGTVRLGWGEQRLGADGNRYTEFGPDGRLRHARMHMAIWSGRSYELHILRYSGDSEVLLAMLGQLVITETETGIVCAPKDRAATAFVEGPSLIIDVPGFGLLEAFQLTSPKAKGLPRYGGTRVAGGELFVSGQGTPKRNFVMASDSALTYIVPDHGVPDEMLQAGLAELTVRWQPPSVP
jgi:hypothetical protein